MTDRILSLFDMEWIHFGIAKHIQNIHDCKLFGIIDIDNNMKHFFQKQDIVELKKQWFYRDYLQKKDLSYDIDFLHEIEKSYKLNIWNIAFSERFFVNFNPYYKFSYDEILSILHAECKLFDSIIKETNPDFLLIKFTDSHQSHLLHQMCKSKNIKTLMLGPTRFGGRFTIYNEYEIIEDLNHLETYNETQRDELELKKYLENYDTLKTLKPFVKATKKSFVKKSTNYLKNLNILGDANISDYYAHYGKTRFNAIKQLIFLKRWYRKNFIDNNLKKTVDSNIKFIYYPLHVDPERQLLLVAPFYTNQLEIITSIAKSLPADFKLLVKEHGMMDISGWRPISYYQQIMNLPNVELIHPDVDSKILLELCSMVATINGTTGLESLFYKKPVIAFSNVSYSKINSVSRIQNIEELPKIIETTLKSKVDFSELNDYINLIERNSFQIDMSHLYISFSKIFSKEYNTAKSSITVSQMKKFIDMNSDSFEKLGTVHVQQINRIKKSS